MFARLGAKLFLAMVGVALIFFGVGFVVLGIATALRPYVGAAWGDVIAGAIFLVPPLIWALALASTRPPKPALAFGSGPHVCLGMHVARAEMAVGINALLDRLPNLRLDPDAEPPRYIGMYERGATAIPVVFG